MLFGGCRWRGRGRVVVVKEEWQAAGYYKTGSSEPSGESGTVDSQPKIRDDSWNIVKIFVTPCHLLVI